MFRNHLVTSGRAIWRNKTLSALNLAGLSVGIAVALLLALYVQNERSYDRYHEDYDRIYRVNGSYDENGFDGIAKINGPWGIRSQQEIAAIESVTRFTFFGQTFTVVDGDQRPISGALFADSTVFDVFSWRMLAGNPQTALRAPYSVVITRSLAEQLFQSVDVVGRDLMLGGGDTYTITGLLEDIPTTSHFTFPMLVSMASYGDERHDDWWRWNQYYTYVKLADGANPEAVAADMSAVVVANVPSDVAERGASVWLQPLGDIWLRSNQFREMYAMSDLGRVSSLGLLGVLVLVVACVNFVNLITARASLRSREVGVRKSLGANGWSVVARFLTESTLLAAAGGVLALTLALIVVPEFNSLTGKSFTRHDVIGLDALVWLFSFVLGVGLIGGWYPALVQSRFVPVQAMRGVIHAGRTSHLRHAMVVFQFAVSAILLMLAGVIGDQLRFIDTIPLGFEQDNRVAIVLQDDSLRGRLEDIQAAVLNVRGVDGVTLSGNRPGGGDWGIPVEIPGVVPNDVPGIRMLVGDWAFPQVYGLELVDGRLFDPSFGTDRESAVLVNEELVRQLGWTEPIGKDLNMSAVGRELRVVGVVKDFHFRSLHERVAPVMIFMAPDTWYSQMTVALGGNATPETLDALAEVYARFDPVNPFQYVFLDQQFDALYTAERRVRELVTYGTWLALIVASLGLVGLALFAAQRRRREIGIRKVVGASELSIVMMLSRRMATLVLVALGIATPVAWWLSARWLEGYAYATDIQPSTLALSGVITLGVALATTIALSWRASRLDPVSAIRTD